MRLHVSNGHTLCFRIFRICFCHQSNLASCFKRMYLVAFSVCLELCLGQNSHSGCGPFCWSFCLWVSQRWNHRRVVDCSHEVSSVSPVVLCQVAEMVRMETRAVSREFSDSKARAFAVTQKMLVITCFMQFHADLGGSFAQVDGPWLTSNALRW